MAWAFVQTKSVSADTLAYDSAVGAGNLCVAIAVTTAGSGTVTFSDGSGGTWTTDLAVSDVGTSRTLVIGHAENHPAGATTIATSPSAGSVALLIILEYSGTALSTATDVTAGQAVSGTSTPSSGNTAATGAANEVVVGACYDGGGGGTIGAGSGFTLRAGSVVSFAAEDKDSGAVGVQNADFTDTVSAGAKLVVCAVYKVLATTLTWLPQSRVLQGVSARMIASGFLPPSTPT